MQLAFDTNAYTALVQKNPILAELVATTPAIGLPIIVLGEIRFGILHGSRAQAASLILERFLQNDRVEILEITQHTTRLYSEISTQLRRDGRPIQQNDIWIAALCKQYDYRLVTNDRGFDNIVGLEILNF